MNTQLTSGGQLRRQWKPLPEDLGLGPPPKPEETRLQTLRIQSGVPSGALQVDTFLAPVITTGEEQRPLYPRFLLAEQENGLIVGTETLSLVASEAERQAAFITILEKADMAPETVAVPSKEVLRLIRPVAEALGSWAEVRNAGAGFHQGRFGAGTHEGVSERGRVCFLTRTLDESGILNLCRLGDNHELHA